VVIGGVSHVIVGLVAEEVGFVSVTWLMVELKVVLGELNLPGGSTWTNFVRFRPVGEVFVVCPYFYWEDGAAEEV
jgi:hypothetical protein